MRIRVSDMPVDFGTYEFTVQAYELEGSDGLALGPGHKVIARTPEEAAMKILHEQLHMVGNVAYLRAKVWRIGPDYKPIETLLYRRG